MHRRLLGLWLLLAAAFALLAAYSLGDPVTLLGHQLKPSRLGKALYTEPPAPVPTDTVDSVAKKAEENRPDTSAHTILFIGDSMLEGLAPRLAQYAHANGHTLYDVIWYSSSTKQWADTGRLEHYIRLVKPTYVFICLGGNELFIKNIRERRDECVKKLVATLGQLPYLWIGPPNWKEDTGINDLIRDNVPEGRYFDSRGLHYERKKDGAHPTAASAAQWMDSVVRWMPLHCDHPIRLSASPDGQSRSPHHQYMHAPSQ